LHKDDVVCEGRIDGSGNGRKVASDRAHRHFGEEEERLLSGTFPGLIAKP
jgi:hypothetical protein